MTLETLSVLVRVLCHRNQQQHLDVETGDLGVQARALALAQTRFFTLEYAAPAGGPRHPDQLGQLALIACSVALQLVQQTTIGSRQFHSDISSLLGTILQRLFHNSQETSALWTPFLRNSR